MKVYVVIEACMEDEAAIEAIFQNSDAANAYIDATLRSEYETRAAWRMQALAKAERWVAAGGGLTEPVADLASFEEWKAKGARYRVEEHEVRGDLEEPLLIDGCRIVHRDDGFDVCRVHLRYWKAGTEMCPGRR